MCLFDTSLFHIMSKIEIIKTTSTEFNVPKRSDFVNPKLHEKLVTAVAEKQQIYFEPHDCQDNSEYVNGKQTYVVYMFGIMLDGTKTMVILTGIPVYFDILISNNDIVNRGPSINPPKIDVLEISQFKTSIKEGIGADLYNNIMRVEIVEGFPPKRFQTYPSKYLRLYFDNLYARARVLEAVQKLHYDNRQEVPFELAHDDLSRNNPSYYFNVVARTYKFNTCSWNILDAGKYNVAAKGAQTNPSSKCDYCFRVDVTNFKPLDDQTISRHDYFNKSRQIMMTWDIETYSSDRQTGEIPSPEAEDTNIFMICATFHWQFTEKALLKVCCVDNPTAATPEVFFDTKALEAQSKLTGKPIEEIAREQSQVNVLIECGNERDLCWAFARVVAQMSPDFIGAFNGGSFDWPFYRERMHKYGLMRELYNCFSALKPTYIENDTKKIGGRCSIYRRRFKEEKVKISAEESASMLCAQFPGMIDTDIMIVFKQLYTKAEVGRGSSLNFYLRVNKLQGKEDLPYKEMFRIYEKSCKWVEQQKALDRGDLSLFNCDPETTTDDELQSIIKAHEIRGQENRDAMALVAKYCVVDAFRCQQLYTVKSIIADRKEVSNMAYVTIYDAFYRANGMKVRNLVGSFCCDPRFNIMFSNGKQTNVKIKYPGAHVFPPKKGLNNARPVVGLDFSSLYPSLMMAYNLSPEKAIDEINLEIDTITDRGYNHVCAARKFAEDLAKLGYDLHYTKFDGTIQDDTRADNGKIVTVSGWIVRHSNIIEPGDKPKNKIIEKALAEEKPRDCGLQGEKMGVFPFILKILFDKRKKIKNRFIALSKLIEIIDILRKDNPNKSDKEIFALINPNDFNDTGFNVETCDYAELKFQRNAVNSKQNALKVYMNTFYGEQGNYLSSIYKLLVAGGITSAGQYNIKMVADYLVKHQYCVWYGDSVASDTPILVQYTKDNKTLLEYRTIDEISDGKWEDYHVNPDEINNPGRKQASGCFCPDLKVWSDKGFTKITRVIRHKTNKKLFRVLTHTGCVDVTEDHSLLNEKAEKITPAELIVNSTKLLHSNLPQPTIVTNDFDINEAYAMGLFYADGSCGTYNCTHGIKRSWALNNQNLDYLREAQEGLERIYGKFKILDTMGSSKVYKLVPCFGDFKVIVDKYRRLFYDKNKYKKVPVEILNASKEFKERFIKGYLAGDGDKDKKGYFRFDNKGKIGSAGLYYLVNSLGYPTSINIRSDKMLIYRLTCTRGGNNQRIDPNKVKKIMDLGPTDDYVYDLETENHHFAAGVGRLVVHNTDSNYISCNDALFKDTDKVYDLARNLILNELKSRFDSHLPAESADISAEARTVISKNIGPLVSEHQRIYEKQEHALAKKAISFDDFNKWNQSAYELVVQNALDTALKYINTLENKELSFQVLSMLRFVIREIYWTQLVQITRRDLNDLRVKVNTMLANDNGTAYLTMAYEEVLFPVVFTGKKKYFGLAHLERENFHPAPKDIFVRGIDIIKQGQAKLAKDIGYEILAEICSVENELEMIDIVHKAIEKIYSKDWALEYFVLNGKYKPNKQNIPIQTFVSRMRQIHAKYDDQSSPEYNPQLAALYAPPIPGDTFQYVIVKYDQSYDLRGNKINLKKGDKMEYLAVFNHLTNVAKNPEDRPRIDLNHYISGAIIGLFARFLAYRAEFQPPASVTDPEEIDTHSVREANKYVEKYCEKRAGINREALISQGRGLRKNSKLVQKSMKKNIIAKYGQSAHVLMIIGDNAQYDSKYDSSNPEISHSKKQELEIARQKHEANMNIIKEYAKKLAGEPFLGRILLEKYKEQINSDPTFIYALKLTYAISGGFSRQMQTKKDAINITSIRLNYLNKLINEQEIKISNMLKYIIEIEKYEIYKCDELLQASAANQSFDFQNGLDNLAVVKTEDEKNYKKTLDEYNSAILRLASLYKLRDNYADVPIKINEYINKKLRVQQRVVVSKEELKSSEYTAVDLGKLHDY